MECSKPIHWSRSPEIRCVTAELGGHGIMGWEVAEIQLGDVIKQGSGDSRPMGAQHSDTTANHTDLQSGCGRPCVFAVRVWSNLFGSGLPIIP